ncbi:MAG: hypothetical protein AAB847_02870, partial [Patescibacteria group bacterium]
MDFPQNNTGGVVPPPPQAEVNVRTMESDTKSMQEQGGAAPVPQQVSPSEVAFKSEEPTPHSGKRVWWLLLVLIIVAGGGAGAYYYYFIMNNEITPGNENIASETNTPPAEEAPATISLTNLNAALKNESGEILPPDNFKEITLVGEQEKPLSFLNVVSVILPELTGTELANTIKNNFKDEFQTYLYYDENGVWPVYKAMLKDDSSIDIMTLRAQLLSMENASIGNFYIDPLGPAAPFKDGQVNSYPTRYSSFSNKVGASFNYGLINSDLYLSTSYQGLKKILES